MQEIKKRRIVLASVLKPIDDTRMFEKMATSLDESGEYEVTVIGYPTQNETFGFSSIRTMSLSAFGRLSLKRLIAPIRIFQKVIKVKPEVLIVNTHELLIVGIVNRIFFGTRFIYDIQENYWRNIILTNAFPRPLRPILALWVRLKEKIITRFADWIFLAEKGYKNELTFLRKNFSVLENKARLPAGFKRSPDLGMINLLFSGTLAENTGLFESINLAKNLHQVDPSVRLHIIGYSAINHTYKKLLKAIEGCHFIKLSGGDSLVPHNQIFEAISKSDFGLIYYPPSPHVQNSIPTKLYEYLSCGLPIILQDYEPWTNICEPFQASINTNFLNHDTPRLLQQLKNTKFYETPPTNVSWDSEEKKLLTAIHKVL
jgi:hypothetical protein